MKKLLLITVAALAFATQTKAQEVAPGWRPTGHWQCGPVRIITSTDGFGGLDFFVVGAWFDNHYTLQKDNLYYNGVPCMPVGDPWPLMPRRKSVKMEDDRPDK
jgi:hypothetical protein